MSKRNYHEAVEILKKYFFYYMVFAFLGWVFEVIICLIVDGRLENPGVLRGPVVPIYGFGMVAIVILGKHVKRWWQLFIVSMVVSGIFEYVTAVALETIYQTRWWDYTGFWLDFQGRICVEALSIFAVMACLFYYLLLPVLEKFYDNHKGRVMDFVLLMCLIAILFDTGYMVAVGPNTGHAFVL